MSKPQGFVDEDKPHFVYKLKKTFYGLKQAPRAQFEKLKNALLSGGFVAVVSDTSLFILGSIEVRVYILIYIDDKLLKGCDSIYIQNLIKDLNVEFSLKYLGPLGFFLGI